MSYLFHSNYPYFQTLHLGRFVRSPARIEDRLASGSTPTQRLCHVACHDGAHQCIHLPGTKAIEGNYAPMASTAAKLAVATANDPVPYRVPWVDETECVGCNLCNLVGPVEGCITMVEKRRAADKDTWNQRIADGRNHVPGGLGQA